ncbi:MAG: HlyC/CorC family transporter [Myxococcales bacterium]|nr:HlyC/CorC family transporter [Myxococcales bacterium]
MISLSLVLLVAVVCISIEAFFSGSEIAMVSASRPLLRTKVKAGHRGAVLVEKYLDSPQTLLATTLLGTNLAVVTFSVIVTVYLAQGGYGGGELLAVLMVTPFTLIMGEVIPKTLFQQRADDLVTRLIFPLHAASLVLRPLILVVGGFAQVTSKLFGADVQRAFVTREELSLLLEAAESSSASEAEITESEREMISNLLDMSGDTVSAVMLPLSEITAIPQETSVAEAVREVADKQHSRMPVYEGRVDNIVGVLHVFDLLQVGAHKREGEIRKLARPAHYVPESFLAVNLLGELQGSGKTMAIVVDEYGGAVGVVTIEDLLEEIVGEIEDEHDDATSMIVADQPGVWTVEAKVSVDRVNDELGTSLPEDDSYESIAGLILHQLRRLPREGETVLVGEVTLRIVKASNRAVEQVQLLRRRKR